MMYLFGLLCGLAIGAVAAWLIWNQKAKLQKTYDALREVAKQSGVV